MSQGTLIKKAIQTFRQEGMGSLLRETWEGTGRRLEPLEPATKILALAAMRAIKHLDPNERDVIKLVDFVSNRFAGLIKPAQVQSEIVNLANVVRDLMPKAVLEIGTAKGGTLFLFSRLASPSATVVSIDLPGGSFGGGYPEWKTKFYRTFALPRQTMHLLRADSNAVNTLERVRSMLGKTSLDFLFIDGDHTYEGVKQDFELYSPLVRKGGVIAFHDIAVHPPEARCEVSKFWSETKNQTSREFIENRDQQWAGIGVYPVV
jgi:predicted O-methyltransferase YrrM